MVTLNYEDSIKFEKRIKEDLKHPLGPVPTPKLEKARKMILEDLARKTILEDLEKLEKLLKKYERKKGIKMFNDILDKKKEKEKQETTTEYIKLRKEKLKQQKKGHKGF